MSHLTAAPGSHIASFTQDAGSSFSSAHSPGTPFIRSFVACVRTPFRRSQPSYPSTSHRSSSRHSLAQPSSDPATPDPPCGFPRPIAPRVVESSKYYRSDDYFIRNKEEYGFEDVIRPMCTSFKQDVPLPEGWDQRCVAPEGNPYFIFGEHPRVYTLTNLYNEENVDPINAMAQAVISKLSTFGSPPEDTEIVVDVQGYYLVSWSCRCIFWLEKVDQDVVTENRYFALSPEHMGRWRLYIHGHLLSYGRQAAQWKENFGEIYKLLKELKALMTWQESDLILSRHSTCRWDDQTIERAIRNIDRIQVGEHDLSTTPAYTATFARYMVNIFNNMFENYHGESCARLLRHESVYLEERSEPKRSYIFRFLSLLLFHQPSVYLSQLKHVYVDGAITVTTWTKFIQSMQKDWENSITPATVLLSANIGFLAIQSIDNDPGSTSRSFAQLASYVSAVLSLSIYLVVQILQRQHRQHPFESAERPLSALLDKEEVVGLQMIAISVSLPIGLFIWSTIGFFIALIFIFFHKASRATHVTLGIALAILVIFVSALLYMDYLEAGENGDSLVRRITLWMKSKRDAMCGYFSRHKSTSNSIASSDSTVVESPDSEESAGGRPWKWRLLKRFSSSASSNGSGSDSILPK